MATNLVGLKQLKLMIKPSIPDKNEYIEFTSDLLDIKGKSLSKYPYFTDTIPYPRIKLQNFTYERIVDFFFNKNTFQRLIRSTTRKNMKGTTKPNKSQIKYDNFELTLRLLFPTTFPLVNNIDNSLEYIVPSKKIFTLKGSNLFKLLPTRFNRNFSYLKIGSETYTITKTVWNNDVMNHPIYSEIIQTYKQFDMWKSDPSNNFLNNSNDENQIMNDILRNILKKVFASDEKPLLKPMYSNTEKAPYGKNASVKDENALSMQEFDKTVNIIMQKDEKSLNTENANYFVDCNNIINNIKFTTNAPPSPKDLYKEFKDRIPMKDQEIDNLYKSFKHYSNDAPQNKESIDKLIELFYKINENERKIQQFKKHKQTNVDETYYMFFEKPERKEKEENIINNLIAKPHDYKLKLINLLGKLTLANKLHNVSPDFASLIEYLKTSITNNFIVNRNIRTFINDLNIRFLKNPDHKLEKDRIKTNFIEFYNLALVISNLKGRYIDNPIWNSVVTDMRNGNLKNGDFDTKIWNTIENCYNLYEDDDDDDDEDDENADADTKAKKKAKKKAKDIAKSATCNTDPIQVGLDIISNSNDKENDNKPTTKIQTIEAFLQIDLIEGRIDENNMNKIKCAYDDEFLGSMFRDLINTGKRVNAFPAQQVFFSAKHLLEGDNSTTKKIGGGKKQKKHTTKKIYYK